MDRSAVSGVTRCIVVLPCHQTEGYGVLPGYQTVPVDRRPSLAVGNIPR